MFLDLISRLGWTSGGDWGGGIDKIRMVCGIREKGPQGGVGLEWGRKVPTDKNGHYTLPVSNDTIIFVIKPRGWTSPLGLAIVCCSFTTFTVRTDRRR